MKQFNIVLTSGTLILSLAGCGKQPAAAPKADAGAAAHDHDHHHHDHDHHSAGPHGGAIAEWGHEQYHVEFTVDHDKKEAVVYVLGSDAKTAEPVKTTVLLLSIDDPQFQLALAAKPLDGEADGLSSRFVGQHDDLGKVQEFSGSISAEIDGTPYAGDFKEEADDHDHKH